MHESLVEALLDNIFRILPDSCVPQNDPKNFLLVTLEKRFKRLFVSVLGGNHESLFPCGLLQASNTWFCFVFHTGPPDECQQKARPIFNLPSFYAMDKGKAYTKLAGS